MGGLRLLLLLLPLKSLLRPRLVLFLFHFYFPHSELSTPRRHTERRSIFLVTKEDLPNHEGGPGEISSNGKGPMLGRLHPRRPFPMETFRRPYLYLLLLLDVVLDTPLDPDYGREEEDLAL